MSNSLNGAPSVIGVVGGGGGTSSSNNYSEKNLTNGDEPLLKIKNYRIRNSNWYCEPCEVYCNSQSQFDVHLISQKHKFVVNKPDEQSCASREDDKLKGVEQSVIKPDEKGSTYKARISFSLAEIAQNPLAIKFQIDPVKYLITEDKKIGKFEKFGFYCKTCDAYMTGQIQLIMHVRGAKHQFYNEGEIPGYVNTSNKKYNPHHKRKIQRRTRNGSKSNFSECDYNNNRRMYKNNNYGSCVNPNNINNNSNSNNSTNRVPKGYGVQASIGHQNIFEHFNNSINNTTIYSIPHVTPIKMTNDSLKDNNYMENRIQYAPHDYKSNLSFQSPLQSSYSISKLNQTPGLQFAQNGYLQSPARYTPDLFNTNNDRLYAYNVNMVSNGLNQMHLKEEKLNENDDLYLYNTPPPEPNPYPTNNLQYVQKPLIEFQPQQPQQQHQHQQPQSQRPTPPSQFIFQSRISHTIPVIMSNFPASPISSNFPFHYPGTPVTQQSALQPPPPQSQQQSITNQQVHQTF